MGRTKPKKGAHAKKKGFKKSRDTKRRARDVDQIYDDVEKAATSVEYDDELPGGGQFYCVETGRHFVDENALEAHKKTRFYKRRVKELAEERQYTQQIAEWAAGMTREELPRVRGGMILD
ncbi:hypothetical protein CTAYLR_010181 [Chrysophaeum taylorii]|uniref:C2H2-type domain-containing protein n=1 Tax=Chrysophaeum taylorii TaxID=2483200 RepID=A0AAD7XEZ0_9STRA|nr:hypothetical protein CTAYLR_010181 [Chrysophaeum taylorii]